MWQVVPKKRHHHTIDWTTEMKKKFFYGLCCLFFVLQSWAESGKTVVNNGSESDKNLQNEPLFKDGKGYYSYVNPIKLELPKNKVLIQYFYHYGCAVCLNADDYLKAYAERNADKVILQRSPAFEKGSQFTAQMHATFAEFGRPELADKYLFDSADTIPKGKLVDDNEAIKRWLMQNGIKISEFHQVFSSDKVKQRVENALALYKTYSPPRSPIAILNGKYILISNTLYNDDYTYAVLDFLVEKLQQEQESK